jgi:structural maintenance of chromosome 1
LSEEELREYRHLKDRASRQLSSVREQQGKLRRAKQSDEVAAKHYLALKQGLDEQRKNLVNKVQGLEARVEQLNKYLSENRKALDEQQRQYNDLEQNQTSSAHRLIEIEAELVEVEDKLRDLHMSSFEEEKKQKRSDILSALQSVTQGVYGRVYELCEAKHKRHMIALVRSIGRHLDDIVVDTADTARICIKYLRDQALGVEHFLPLADLKVKPTDERLRNLGGTAKLVLDCVKLHSPEIKKAIQFCVGNDILCESADEARDIAYKSKEGRTVCFISTVCQCMFICL